jgi:hypothetical protein
MKHGTRSSPSRPSLDPSKVGEVMLAGPSSGPQGHHRADEGGRTVRPSVDASRLGGRRSRKDEPILAQLYRGETDSFISIARVSVLALAADAVGGRDGVVNP